jgi:hypothetical protein
VVSTFLLSVGAISDSNESKSITFWNYCYFYTITGYGIMGGVK